MKPLVSMVALALLLAFGSAVFAQKKKEKEEKTPTAALFKVGAKLMGNFDNDKVEARVTSVKGTTSSLYSDLPEPLNYVVIDITGGVHPRIVLAVYGKRVYVRDIETVSSFIIRKIEADGRVESSGELSISGSYDYELAKWNGIGKVGQRETNRFSISLKLK